MLEAPPTITHHLELSYRSTYEGRPNRQGLATGAQAEEEGMLDASAMANS